MLEKCYLLQNMSNNIRNLCNKFRLLISLPHQSFSDKKCPIHLMSYSFLSKETTRPNAEDGLLDAFAYIGYQFYLVIFSNLQAILFVTPYCNALCNGGHQCW